MIVPDVGEGFGTTCSVYPEDILIPFLAVRIGRPVKWIETRRDHLESATHSREQVHDAGRGTAAEPSRPPPERLRLIRRGTA